MEFPPLWGNYGANWKFYNLDVWNSGRVEDQHLQILHWSMVISSLWLFRIQMTNTTSVSVNNRIDWSFICYCSMSLDWILWSAVSSKKACPVDKLSKDSPLPRNFLETRNTPMQFSLFFSGNTNRVFLQDCIFHSSTSSRTFPFLKSLTLTNFMWSSLWLRKLSKWQREAVFAMFI